MIFNHACFGKKRLQELEGRERNTGRQVLEVSEIWSRSLGLPADQQTAIQGMILTGKIEDSDGAFKLVVEDALEGLVCISSYLHL